MESESFALSFPTDYRTRATGVDRGADYRRHDQFLILENLIATTSQSLDLCAGCGSDTLGGQ